MCRPHASVARSKRLRADVPPFRLCLYTDNEIARSPLTASRAETAPRGVANRLAAPGGVQIYLSWAPLFCARRQPVRREKAQAANDGTARANCNSATACKPVHSPAEPEAGGLAAVAVGHQAFAVAQFVDVLFVLVQPVLLHGDLGQHVTETFHCRRQQLDRCLHG